jgi:hypothetical protein
MFRPRARTPKDRRDRPGFSVLPDDPYIQIEPWPRLGRPPPRDPETWRVTFFCYFLFTKSSLP